MEEHMEDLITDGRRMNVTLPYFTDCKRSACNLRPGGGDGFPFTKSQM